MKKLLWLLFALLPGVAQARIVKPTGVTVSASPVVPHKYTDSRTIGFVSLGNFYFFVPGNSQSRVDLYPFYVKNGTPTSCLAQHWGVTVLSGSILVKPDIPNSSDTTDASAVWLSAPDSVGKSNTLSLPILIKRMIVRTKTGASNASGYWWAY